MRPLSLRVVNSITELVAADAGCLAVCGSHGGQSSAGYAMTARPLLSVFNDAGIGKNQAGIAALEIMQAAGLAACTVSHDSACIGIAQSSLAHGIISHSNPLAVAMGCHVGLPLREVIHHQLTATQNP